MLKITHKSTETKNARSQELVKRTLSTLDQWAKLSPKEMLDIPSKNFKSIFSLKMIDLYGDDINNQDFQRLKQIAKDVIEKIFNQEINADNDKKYIKLFSTGLQCFGNNYKTLFSFLSPNYEPLYNIYNPKTDDLLNGFNSLKKWILEDFDSRFKIYLELCKQDISGRLSFYMYSLQEVTGETVSHYIDKLQKPQTSKSKIKPSDILAKNPELLEQLERKSPKIYSLISDQNWLQEFIQYASLLRLLQPDRSFEQFSSKKSPLQYAIDNKLYIELSDGVCLCCMSQSFRRFIIFEKTGNDIRNVIQIKIPGQHLHKSKLKLQSFDMAQYLAEQGISIIKPIAFIELPKGDYVTYGAKKTRFKNESPCIEISEYQDGDRCCYASLTDIEKEIVKEQIKKILTKIHNTGYLMHNELNDHNFIVYYNKKGEIKVKLVNDCGGFKILPKTNRGLKDQISELDTVELFMT